MCCPKHLYDNCRNSLKNGSIPLTFCTLKAPTALPPPKYVAGQNGDKKQEFFLLFVTEQQGPIFPFLKPHVWIMVENEEK